ncbi:hypothetical protein W5O_05544 [Candida albicans Ca6]|nr:hypothetical protein MGM_05452 [Candida albicans P75063]KHC30785.1 hypothetical protein W5O_05544 [Candida albicans Ca6]
MNEEATINFLSFFFFFFTFSLSLSSCVVCCVCRKFFSLLLLLWFSLISVLVYGWCYYDFRSSSPGFFLFRSRLALTHYSPPPYAITTTTIITTTSIICSHHT